MKPHRAQNYSNRLDIEKSPENLRRLVIPKIPAKYHQLELLLKTQKVNNYNNNNENSKATFKRKTGRIIRICPLAFENMEHEM